MHVIHCMTQFSVLVRLLNKRPIGLNKLTCLCLNITMVKVKKFFCQFYLKWPSWWPQGSNFLSGKISEWHWHNVWSNWMKSVEEVVLIWADNIICLYWTVTLNRLNRILPTLQTEHNSDKTFHEAAKYLISFILNCFLKEKVFWKLF